MPVVWPPDHRDGGVRLLVMDRKRDLRGVCRVCGAQQPIESMARECEAKHEQEAGAAGTDDEGM